MSKKLNKEQYYELDQDKQKEYYETMYLNKGKSIKAMADDLGAAYHSLFMYLKSRHIIQTKVRITQGDEPCDTTANVHIPKELKRRFDVCCKKNGVTNSLVLRECIDSYVDKYFVEGD